MNFSLVSNITIPEGSVVKITDSLNRVIWKKQSTPEVDYFWIENISGEVNNVELVRPRNAPIVSLEYKIDNGDWSSCDIYNGVDVPIGSKIFFRGDNSRFCGDASTLYNQFSVVGNYNIGGDITTLLNKDGNVESYSYDYVFCNLFTYSLTLINADELTLKVKNLSDYCYYFMFCGCSKLVTAPQLPATTLANYCYCGMFQQCSKLINAPKLPSTNGTYQGCYNTMFAKCSSLQTIYFGSLLQPFCGKWVLGVPSSGTFYKNSQATWENTFGENAIPEGWNVVEYDY